MRREIKDEKKKKREKNRTVNVMIVFLAYKRMKQFWFHIFDNKIGKNEINLLFIMVKLIFKENKNWNQYTQQQIWIDDKQNSYVCCCNFS